MVVARGRLSLVVERGRTKTFAGVLDWPGWCRSGRDEAAALDALARYLPRYAPVAATARLTFPKHAAFEIVERLAGSASTDFGVPGAIAASERRATTRTDAARLAALVAAAWAQLDLVALHSPAVLRKGPRGGGRDRDAIVTHVIDAEVAYARKLGLQDKVRPPLDAGARSALRAAILRRLEQPTAAVTTKGPWPPRYAARRVAWHALDHAWEIEDRAGGPEGQK